MRVSLISPYYPRATPGHDAEAIVGGVERAIDALADALQHLGAEVTIHCTSQTKGLEVLPSGVRVERVLRRAVLYRAPISTLALRIPRSADVAHVPATYPTVSDLAVLTARAKRVPVALDYHFDAHATTPGMARATRAYYATLGRAMLAADRVLVKTQDYADASPFVARVRRERLRVLPNGVHASRFDVEAPRTNDVLCVGRLVPYKGVENLVRAMQGVQRDFEAPLVVAGNGPLRESLETLARDLGVNARFLGFVPDGDLPRVYVSARVTVLPSANGQEAFGMTLLESMAAGTPVIASDLPGVRTVARIGGLTTPPNDVPALERAIRRVLKGEADLPSARALKQRVAAEHDWKSVAERALEIYEDIIAQKGRRRA